LILPGKSGLFADFRGVFGTFRLAGLEIWETSLQKQAISSYL